MKARFLAAAIALGAIAGCATDESGGFLSVSNDTDRVLLVFPFPDGTLIDPIPHLPPGNYQENLILSGHRLGFDTVPGYRPGNGVFLFVYVVQRQGADLVMGLTVSDLLLKLHHRNP